MSVLLNVSANHMIIVSNVLEIQFQNKNSTRDQVFIMCFLLFFCKRNIGSSQHLSGDKPN